MQSQLKWKKKIFSNLYRIYGNVGEIGHLKERSFSNTATAALHKDRYTFKTTGFLDPLTEIIDEAENKVIGKIKYGKWMTKATIYFDGKEVYWRYDNMWN